MNKYLSSVILSVISLLLSAKADLTDKLEKTSFAVIPSGEYTLDRTVEIKHDLTVILENGAVLKSSCDPMFRITRGEFRMEGRGKPGKIISTSKGSRGWSSAKRGAAFDLNHADGKTSLRFFLRNIQVQAYNGVDGFQFMPDKHGIEEINITECTFKCTEKAIATHSLVLGTARIENCSFDGGDNPIFLDSATPGGMVIRGNTLRNFGRVGMKIGKAGQIAEGCTSHLPDTIVHDNRLIGGGHSSTIRDSYIHGILIYGNNVSVQGNIVRNVNRGEPVPGSRIGHQFRAPDGRILRSCWISLGKERRRRLAGSAIYLKATRAIVQGNICSNSGFRSVIEIKTGGKEYFTSVVNNVVDGRSLAIDQSFGFECHAGRSLWAGNVVYDMPHQAFVVRSGYENTFINNLICDSKIGFALSGNMPGQNELIAGNRFINVEHPVAVDKKENTEGVGEDILLPPPARIENNAELPEPGPKWHGRQIVRGDKIYLGIRQGEEYCWMEMQGKVLPVKRWDLSGPELFRNSDMSGKERFEVQALNDPRYPGWILTGANNARGIPVPEEDRGLRLDKKIFKTGGASQKIIFPKTAAQWILSRRIKLTPNRRYRATVVFKAEEPRNIQLCVMPGGQNAVKARGKEIPDWQTLTVDFVQSAKTSNCTLSIQGSKTTMDKAAWIDSVSVRELREQVTFIGNNRLSDQDVWKAGTANTRVTRLSADSIQVTSETENATMAICKITLPPKTIWRFTAEIEPVGTCSAVLPDGKKLNGKNYLDFTVPDQKGTILLRFWIPGQKPGSVTTIRNITLRQRES